jgi:methionine synthase II (cobalamin-independent)
MIKRNPLPWANGKFCLTGPYSLTKQCYLDVEGVSEFEWIDHFAKLVAAQISVLSKEFKYIQINEPALAGTDDFALFDQGLHKLKEYESLEGISQNCSIILSAPGADLSQDVLWTLVSSCAWNGEIIHLDLVNGWRSVDRLQWICKERNHTIRFQLGVLSGESLYAGVNKDAVDKVRETLSILPNAKCELITTSCGVGNLPWEVAVERIRQTKSVADECGQLIKVNGGTLL